MKIDLSDYQYSQTLIKALRVLDVLCCEQPEWGIRELARELDIDPATVHRLVKTFHATGFVEQNSENQRYSLGAKVMKLSSAYSHRNPLPTIASKVFESYSDRFAYNYYLGAIYNLEVIYLAVLDGRGPIKIAVDPGATLDPHATALGKVLLAFQDEEFTKEFLSTSSLRAFTPQTITNPDQLLQQLKEIRANGFAVNDGEYYNDIGAVGVPVYDSQGKVSTCVSLAYPRHLAQNGRFQIEDLVSLAQEIANEITVRSGGYII
jgi:DNA-binding IclR family transcriptional regulator